MSKVRYTDEFKSEAVKQVLERSNSVREVAQRLGINNHSLRQDPEGQNAASAGRRSQGKVKCAFMRDHLREFPGVRDVPGAGGAPQRLLCLAAPTHQCAGHR